MHIVLSRASALGPNGTTVLVEASRRNSLNVALQLVRCAGLAVSGRTSLKELIVSRWANIGDGDLMWDVRGSSWVRRRN